MLAVQGIEATRHYHIKRIREEIIKQKESANIHTMHDVCSQSVHIHPFFSYFTEFFFCKESS